MSYIEKLEDMGACPEALDWLREGKYRTLQAAWDACREPRWLLWLLGQTARTGADRRRIVACAATFARSVLHLVPAGEERPRLAVELAERYAAGETVSTDDLTARAAAASDTRDAACFAAYYAAAAAARAAARAAAAFAWAVWVADAAVEADVRAPVAARRKKLAELADMVRTLVPQAPRLGVKP